MRIGLCDANVLSARRRCGRSASGSRVVQRKRVSREPILLRDRDVTQALARFRLRIHVAEASRERVGDCVCGLPANVD
jgi:hypothetical protein